jgi:hypothetical protein
MAAIERKVTTAVATDNPLRNFSERLLVIKIITDIKMGNITAQIGKKL